VPWKLTIRSGPRVERDRFDDLEAAFRRLEQRAGELAAAAPDKPMDLRVKRFEPAQLVSARLELSGPERMVPSIRAGIDVRGDGSTEAYVGRVRRTVVKQRRGESPFRALRRTIESRHPADTP
jgi:hypothetical protein